VRVPRPGGWGGVPGGETQALQAHLARHTAPLDHDLLNRHLPAPGDAALARWLLARLELPPVHGLGVRSAHDRGADLDAAGALHLWRRFRLEAAHRLPAVPPGHKCGRMHGHSFGVMLHARGEGLDHDALGHGWAPLHAELDHRCLNDIAGLENPTSEVLAAWIWQRLRPVLPGLSQVSVFETASAGCHFDGGIYRIFKALRFESALVLETAPEGDPRRRLHGHSYTLRLHLCAPLDPVLAWTVDYGDVKTLFQPIYRELDHHRLDRLEGRSDAGTAALLHWIRARVQARLPQLDRIDLEETPGCGAMLCWGDHGPALPV
jgi:6-pyruvoyltetrahydropterin/6-carboxytetrahydropterin synthase